MSRLLVGGLLLILLATFQVAGQPSSTLQVVVVSPRGETSTIDQTQAIFASFNLPMVPLRAAPSDSVAGPMSIAPEVKGKYHWMGTKTLVFIPYDTLPYATAFTVRVPAGSTSLSGKTLRAEYRWGFETPRPRVVFHSPTHTQQYVELDHSILIQFNQRVNPQIASRFITIEEQGGTEVTYPLYNARYPTTGEMKPFVTAPSRGIDSTTAVLILPVGPFHRSRTYVVRCLAGLLGTEGLLGMPAEYSFSFSTYNALTFKGVGLPDRFDPSLPLRLLFSNPVSIKEVLRRLSFEPPVRMSEEQSEYDYQTDEPSIPLPLEAESEYKGILKAGLKDRFGNEMLKDEAFRFRTGSFKPYVRMTTGPGVVEEYESHSYPITFMNMDSVSLQLGKVSPDNIVPLMKRLDFSYYTELTEDEGESNTSAEQTREFTVSRIWKVKGPRNKQFVRPVEIDEVLGKGGTGVVLVQVDNLRPEPEKRYFKSLLQVTNLGITTKLSPESNLIWVTRLKDASPVSNALVELRDDSNRVIWSGRTDKSGLAQSPGWGSLGLVPPNEWQQPRQWVVVRSENDVAFSSSEWQRGIEPWSFGITEDWSPRYEPMQGTLFTDRGLYKAGEVVQIKAIVRTRSQGTWKLARSARVRLTVNNSRNEEVYRRELTLSPFGSLAESVQLKGDAPLGYYSMVLEKKDAVAGKQLWAGVGFGSFRVEAFRPAEFEVVARSDKQSYIVGDTLFGYLSARYLFGGALKRQPVNWRISTSSTSWTPKGWDGYYFGPLWWLSRYGRRSGFQLLASQEQTLDEQGAIRVRSQLKVGEIVGTVSLLLEGDVTSPSRQLISGRTSVIVHGGEFYLGIAPAKTLIETGSPLAYKVIAVAHNGASVLDVSVHLKVFQRVWRSVRKAESGGRYAWISEEDDIVVDSATVQSGEKPVELSLEAKQAGFYYIQAEAKDKRGNAILTQAYFYVSGLAYVAWERSDDDRIELVADKAKYSPGEVAQILVKSPYEQATALVTIEREGILQHFTYTLIGSAPQVDLPIRKEHIPNVFVSVVLLQGRKEEPPNGSSAGSTKEADVGRPSFKVGYVDLPVSPKEKRLAVRVATDRMEYHPGDSVEVNIQVNDSEGNPSSSEVTLSVADLGVLNLIGYRLPDVFEEFYAERPLSVKTTETRVHLVEQRNYGEKGEDAGGGGAQEQLLAMVDAEGLRKDFRYTAYWNPSVQTSAEGRASLRFKLPDNLTSFQVMAVAQTLSSEFGKAETTLMVNKPLLLQPSYPRFARVGDSFEGGVVLHNYSSEEKTVVLLTSAKGIRLIGADSSVHQLGPGQATEVRKKYTAERAGKATFIFRARSKGETDGLQWTIPIHHPRSTESVALYESTTDSLTRERIAVPPSIYPDIGEVRVEIASTALVKLSGGISYLFSYPYGCLEQRLSAILPVILAEDLVKAFKLEVYRDKDYRQAVLKTLDDLAAFQRPSGGFSYWKGDQQESPYASAYAIYTLVEAQRKGYPVSQRTLQRGLEYIGRVLRGEESYGPYTKYSGYTTRALILYTLALLEKPDHGYMEKLYSNRRELPLFAEAYLLRALTHAKGKQSMSDELIRDLGNRAKISQSSAHFEERNDLGLAWVFDSNVRTTALILQALVETQPKNLLIPRVLRWLLDQQKNGAWRTTQENLYVVDALATYFRTFERQEADFKARVSIAGHEVLNQMFTGRTLATATTSMPLASLRQGTEERVVLRKAGSGELFYGLRMDYAPRGGTKAKEEGLTVLKTIEPVEGTLEKDEPFKVGTMYRVTLNVVTNQSRNFVVVDDPLPAGFETVNTSLQTSAANLEQLLRESNSAENWTFNPFTHQEAYDDHVLVSADFLPAGVYSFSYLVRATSLGTFSVPTTRAEAMYEPEVFGQTGSSVVVIK